jgi:hypothetical protein
VVITIAMLKIAIEVGGRGGSRGSVLEFKSQYHQKKKKKDNIFRAQ